MPIVFGQLVSRKNKQRHFPATTNSLEDAK